MIIASASPSSSRSLMARRRQTCQRSARIALLGCGAVGAAIARALLESRRRLEQSAGVGLSLARILVRDLTRPRQFDRQHFTTDIREVLSSEPDLVIEVMGGIEPAASHVAACLERGIPVITANKSLIARHGSRLREVARRHGATLAYEAAVGAAVPMLAALRSLTGDDVQRVRGVINGSCNYILTRMAEADLDLDEALREARALGLVEPDPSADISGRDSAEKLRVLAESLGLSLKHEAISVEGIHRIERTDIHAARRFGCAIRLIAELEITLVRPAARVGPALLPRWDALAQVQHQENALVTESQLGGRLVLQGPGAGPAPTASAVLGDVVNILRGHVPPLIRPRRHAPVADLTAVRASRHYARIRMQSGEIRPNQALAASEAAAVRITSLEFQNGSMVALTDSVPERAVAAACRALAADFSRQVLIAPLLE